MSARRPVKLAIFMLSQPGLLFSSNTQAIGLAEVIQNALSRHPEAVMAAAHRRIGAAFEEQASSLFGGDPAASLRHQTDQPGSGDGFREWEASLTVPVWLPGQRDGRTQLAETIYSRSDAVYQVLSWRVAGEVQELAWKVRLAESDHSQALQQWNSAQALERDIRLRVAAGELANTNLLLAEQETIGRQARSLDTEGQLELAREAWRSYTGSDELPDDLSELPQQTPTLTSSHPRLLAADAQINQAIATRNDVRLSRRANPELTFYGKRDRGARLEPYNNSFGVAFSLPFGSSSHAAPRIAEAEASLTGTQSERARVQRELELRLEQAGYSVKFAQRASELADQQNRLASNSLRLQQRAFELGESDLVLLLHAREQAADAAQAMQRAELEYQLAISRYTHASGVMPK